MLSFPAEAAAGGISTIVGSPPLRKSGAAVEEENDMSCVICDEFYEL